MNLRLAIQRAYEPRWQRAALRNYLFWGCAYLIGAVIAYPCLWLVALLHGLATLPHTWGAPGQPFTRRQRLVISLSMPFQVALIAWQPWVGVLTGLAALASAAQMYRAYRAINGGVAPAIF